ncbi:hypothetical protein SLS58_008706 [Diplodia intermedia]|uniref:Carboxyphosphonoenolpyruvate phosphonomutase n=1 Tax=Diplodia intermedia TaxID=856260 RepID=A0ABR3TGN4_9PEZI
MSPSILASFPSDDASLREKFSRKNPEDISPVPTKRVKTNNAEPTGALPAAAGSISGHHQTAIPAKDVPTDAQRAADSDDDDDELAGNGLMPTGPIASPSRSTPELVYDDAIDTGYLPASTRLRRRIFDHPDRIVVCPGVFDGFSARVAMSVGFEGLYMTGAGTTASRLGMPDLAIAQLHDMKEQADMICNLDPTNGPPVIADMDAGYGGPVVITRAVHQYARAGVAAFHIEDQILSKRCGHLAGKEVVSLPDYLLRIRAAKNALRAINSDMLLIARTDALQTRGYDECIARLRAARDLGADVGILEGFASKAQAARAVRDLAPWPLLLNAIENGASPLISVGEAQAMGFRVMIFSLAALSAAYVAMREMFERLKRDGVTGVPRDVTPKRLFEVVGLDAAREVDEAAGGAAFSKV